MSNGARAALPVQERTERTERTERRRVRRSEVVSAVGPAAVALVVPCRSLGRDVALDVCSACARCRRMPEDPVVHGAEVVCRVDQPLQAGPRPEDLDVVETALRTPVGEVVSSDAVALEEDVTIEAATTLARDRGLLALTVVDAERRPTAVVTWTDLVAHAGNGKGRVGELGRPLSAAHAVDESLLHALPVVSDATVGYASVIGRDGTFYGLLTAAHVTRWLARRAGYEL